MINPEENNRPGTSPEPVASGHCAFPYAEIPITDEQLPPEPARDGFAENPFAAHLADLAEIHSRLYELAEILGDGHAGQEAESIARAVARVAADLNGDIEEGGRP